MSALHKLEVFVRPALLIVSALVAIAAVAAVLLVASSPSPSPPLSAPSTPAPGLTVAPRPAPPAAPSAPARALAVAPPSAPQPDPNAWPADAADRIRATQRLLGELKLLSEAPTGQPGPVTEAAIRDYQRMAGLEETGEVSEALFVSLKEVAAMVLPDSVRTPD